jgi:hypothetical protein
VVVAAGAEVSDLRAGERKRAIIESVTGQLKNISQMSTLTTVAWRTASSTLWPGSTPARGAKKKPSLNIRVNEQWQPPVLVF